MGTSITFDRAAGFYDQTRSLPTAASEALTSAIVDLGGVAPGVRLLEVGVGTGRIAVPLMQRGAAVIGLDLSLPMLAVARSKWPAAMLVQGDGLRVPLPDHCTDLVLMVHVLHLIGDWQGALAEVQRLLRAGGRLMVVREKSDPDHPLARLRQHYNEATETAGAATTRRGAKDQATLEAFWRDHGWRHEAHEVAAWTEEEAPQEWIDGLRQRLWSSTWRLDDEALDRVLSDLTAWGAAEFGDLRRPLPHHHRLMVDVVIPHS